MEQPLGKGSSDPVLAAMNVVKRFGGLAAVDDVSLGVHAGEIVGLIGPNGAGKTTMFNLLAGAERPSAGRILVAGQSAESSAPHRRIGLGLARTFQIPRPFPEMTVVEKVMLGRQKQLGEGILPNWLRPREVAREERA